MSVGADTYSKTKRLNDEFSIDVLGVRAMFEGYFELSEMALSSWSSVDIKIDFEQALTATIMTPESRLMVGLVYGFNLTLLQASKLAGIKLSEAKEALDYAHEVIEAVLNGYDTTFFNKTVPSTANNLDEWIQDVRAGRCLPFDIPEVVMSNMFHYLVDKKDKLVLAIKSAKTNNDPDEDIDVNDNPDNGYPFYQTSEKIENPNRRGNFNAFSDYDYFREQDRKRVVYSDDIDSYSKGIRVTGKKKTKGDGDNDYKIGRGNIYDK